VADHAADVSNGPTATATLVMVSGPGGVGKTTLSSLIAATFVLSVHLRMDDFMAAIVGGWVDPNRPGSDRQNEAVGGAFAVSAMRFAQDGYTTVADGYFFPDNADGLAAACADRGVECHYVVLTADLDTCWTRAGSRSEGRWPLEFEPFAAVHERFAALDLDPRHLVDATGTPERVRDAVMAALRAGDLVMSRGASTP
jgi:predicted kinase